MKQSTAVIASDSWLCRGSLGHPGKLPSSWKQHGKLPEVQKGAPQIEVMTAVRVQNMCQEIGKP